MTDVDAYLEGLDGEARDWTAHFVNYMRERHPDCEERFPDGERSRHRMRRVPKRRRFNQGLPFHPPGRKMTDLGGVLHQGGV